MNAFIASAPLGADCSRSKKACGVDTAKTGGSIIALRQTSPFGVVICRPMPRTRTVASAAFGLGVARLKRPSTGQLPAVKTCALEREAPLPFDWNSPVKQMPLAWLRR